MDLNRKLYDYCLFKPLSKLGLVPAHQTPPRRLEALIQSLAPYQSGKDLIRIGPDGDGGYLVPDDLEGINALFSPGVSEISGFEKDCADKGMQVYLADASVDGPALQSENFHFQKKFVGCTTSDHFMTLDDWVNQAHLSPDKELMLQMDIEGFEYETLINCSDSLMARFRIIVMECHRLNRLWNRDYFRMVRPAFEKLLQTHTCVHIHPNNCRRHYNHQNLVIPPIAELTFLRKDRFLYQEPATLFPHPLDSANTTGPNPPLPVCWQATS